jgi:hypothetical protein
VTADTAEAIKTHMARGVNGSKDTDVSRIERLFTARLEEIPGMTMRTTEKIITFHRPFCLKRVDSVLPPADYRVVTDEELIEGLSFVAYHRVSTIIFVPAPSGSAVEMVTVDPLELEAAQNQDAAMQRVHPVDEASPAPRF